MQIDVSEMNVVKLALNERQIDTLLIKTVFGFSPTYKRNGFLRISIASRRNGIFLSELICRRRSENIFFLFEAIFMPRRERKVVF